MMIVQCDRQPEKIAEEENKISGKKVTSIWEHMYVHLMEATSATGNAAKLRGKETINSHLFSPSLWFVIESCICPLGIPARNDLSSEFLQHNHFFAEHPDKRVVLVEELLTELGSANESVFY